ncbi:MAG: alpha/beta fold hydrolase, partial [Actinomycetia bacterium]|nr:alpha/beta fold hydrolase [Actinomycetes bacterium]
MSQAAHRSAQVPPPGLAGLDPAWSRLITTPTLDGVGRTWHVLDNRVPDPAVTLLCVHGNPTWSYLWRDLLASAPPGVRVVAIDHLDMGFSERTGTTRRLAQRIDDLCALTDTLGIDGPAVTVAHDWGGPISLGWAERHVEQLAGVILMNTAVHQPQDAAPPGLIRLVRTPGLLERVCVTSPVFVRGAMALSRPRPAKDVRAAYEAPYREPEARHGIGGFVQDIPLDPYHPTRATLDSVADGLDHLADVPTLLLWGPSDPVFSDRYLRDLSGHLPQASIHRFIGGSHMLPEDVDIAPVVYAWLDQLDSVEPVRSDAETRDSLWAAIERRSNDRAAAVVDMGREGAQRYVTFAELAEGVSDFASGLAAIGVEPGDRIALLVPPGIDLALCLYGAWRAGAVVVLVDAGLGVRGIGRALKSANPRYLIGIPKALAAARTMRWPGVCISTSSLTVSQARALGARHSLDEIRLRGRTSPTPDEVDDDAVAAVAFTSGATGPAKGVVYRHRQLQAQRDALIDLYDIDESDRLVAAFGPFALFGPGMGIPSVVPDMDVTSPG